MMFKKGEGWACVPLAVSLVVLYISRIKEQIRRQIAKKEGVLLNFTSVVDAQCSSPDDEQRIRKAIKGSENTIDEVITTLSVTGKYDQQLLTNIERGMSTRRANEGA